MDEDQEEANISSVTTLSYIKKSLLLAPSENSDTMKIEKGKVFT